MKTQSKHKQSGIMTGKRDCAMNDFGLSFDSDWLSRGWFQFLSKGDAKFSRAVKEIEGAKIRAAIRPRKLLYNLLLCDPLSSRGDWGDETRAGIRDDSFNIPGQIAL